MIVFIVADTEKRYREGTHWHSIRNTLEETSGDVCLMIHYKQANWDLLSRVDPYAICHSGSGTDYKDYDVLRDRNYRRIVRDFPAAQIGFCGGHQIIARFFGARLGPMRPLRPHEPDLSDYHPGSFKEWGVYPVRVLRPDPLFRGMGRVIRVPEYHYWEVKSLPKDLVLLASSRNCRVQAFRHRLKPLYGTQFHPEKTVKDYPDGTRVLRSFFRLARAWKKGRAL